MRLLAVIEGNSTRATFGAALAVLCGLALWKLPLGEALRNASYDHLFRFGTRPVTNKVVLVLMDNLAHTQLGQVRTQRWSRALHTKLLNELAPLPCDNNDLENHQQRVSTR